MGEQRARYWLQVLLGVSPAFYHFPVKETTASSGVILVSGGGVLGPGCGLILMLPWLARGKVASGWLAALGY